MTSITTLGFYITLELRLTAIQSKGLSIVINHFAEMLGLICYSEENKKTFINIKIECIRMSKKQNLDN
jgi:hypothetical protein